jgi:hypothetical protein
MKKIVSDYQSEYVSTSDKGKDLYINFSKLLQEEPSENMEIISHFKIGKKSYQSINDLICQTLEREIEFNGLDFCAPYIDISYKIKSLEENYSYQDFLNDIYELAHSEIVVNYTNDYIDKNYTEDMDKKTLETSKSKKINEELQFTDEHCKIIIQASEAIKTIIPLVCDYIELVLKEHPEMYDEELINEKRKIVPNVFYEIVTNIIKLYQPDNINILNKIYRFVYSRIIGTQYSDKVIWNKLNDKIENVDSKTNEYYIDILISIIPKVDPGQNIVNLLHAVTNRKLGFEFQDKYKINFKSINMNQVDSNGLTEYDKFNNGIIKKDESKLIIYSNTIEHYIKTSIGNKISQDEINYYKEKLHINEAQTHILCSFYSKKIESFNVIKSTNKNYYYYLIIYLYKFLIQQGNEILASYLISNPIKNERKITAKNVKINEIVTNCKEYKNLIENKLKYANDIFEVRNNTIIDFIGRLSVTRFEKVQPYDDYIKGNEFEEELLDYKIEDIALAYIQFINYCF